MDRNERELMRALISKVEIAAGVGVLVLCAAHNEAAAASAAPAT